jgi:hypothetical protein
MRVTRNNSSFHASPLIDAARMARHAFYGAKGGPDAEKAITLRQVHGSRVEIARDMNDRARLSETDADALITNAPGVCIGVRTADCLPILVLDPVRGAAGAIHAGWRGAAAGIATEALFAMTRAFGTDPANLIAAIGPAIGPCCYAIGEDVQKAFVDRPGGRGLFTKGPKGLMFDLGLAVELELLSNGVEPHNVSNERACTMCSADFFYSYRRNPGETRRQISAITLVNRNK